MTPYVWKPLQGCDKETLEHLYHDKGMSMRRIGDHLGHTHVCIRNHFNKLGIEKRAKHYIDRPDIEESVIHGWFQSVLERSGLERVDSRSGYPLETLPYVFDSILMHQDKKDLFDISQPESYSKDILEMRILVTLFREELVRKEIPSTQKLRSSTSFVQAFARFYPEEALPYLAENLWRFDRHTRVKFMPVGITDDFQLPNGRPNYLLVYPMLKLIHERWVEHLGRPLEHADLYALPRLTYQDPHWEGQLGLADLEWFPERTIYRLFQRLEGTSGRRNVHIGAYHTPVTHFHEGWNGEVGIANEKYYRFCRDMERFFIRRDAQGRFTESEWNTYDYLTTNRTKFVARENFLWLDHDVLKTWFIRGLGGHHREVMHESWDNFPESASRSLLNKVENLRISMLRHIPFYQQAAKAVSYQTPNMSSMSPSMLHFVSLLWPEFDWDYRKLERNVGSEDFLKEHIIRFMNEETIVLTKTIDNRLWSPAGERVHYPVSEHTSNPGPMSFDIMIPKYRIIIELQGGQHYDDLVYKQGRDEFIVYSQDIATRQFHDRTKKAYAYRRGWLTIYIPCAPNARPVKGVHGPLSCWNFSMDNERTAHTDRRNLYGYPHEGLLELIETQVNQWRKPSHVQRGQSFLDELRTNYQEAKI